MYSLRNGFTASKFTLNNGSQCIFRNWSQDISTIEGGEIGCPRPPVNGTHNIGFWADELVPMPWVETLRFRCVTRSHASEYDGVVRPATGIISFTAVDGWNSVVKSMLTGAKTVESAKADLLDGGRGSIGPTALTESLERGIFPYRGQSLRRLVGHEDSTGGREEGNDPL